MSPGQIPAARKPHRDFPGRVDFRIIVTAAAADALRQVAAVIDGLVTPGARQEATAVRHSRTGRYLSYTVPVTVRDERQLADIYREVARLPCVRHIL